MRLLGNHRAMNSNGLTPSLEREGHGPDRDYGVAGLSKDLACDPALHGVIKIGRIKSVQVD